MSISQLFSHHGFELAVFDLGSRLQAFTRTHWESLEDFQQHYPHPYSQHAWLGFIAWLPEAIAQPNVWFVRLPLDEKNLLVPSARDAVSAHWQRVFLTPDQEHGEIPFGFKPDVQRMAYFHAQALITLQQPPSKFYLQTQQYLSHPNDFSQWPMLGLQGLAEVVARYQEDNNDQRLAQALPILPPEPRDLLLGFFENIQPNAELSNALQSLIDTLTHDSTSQTLALMARAISQAADSTFRAQALQQLLSLPQAYEVECLAAVASRCWADLQEERLLAFLEALARNPQGIPVFKTLLIELFKQPNLRQRCFTLLQTTQVSPPLAAAFEQILTHS